MHGTPTLPSNGKTLPFVVFMACPNQRGFLYSCFREDFKPSHVVLLQEYQITWPWPPMIHPYTTRRPPSTTTIHPPIKSPDYHISREGLFEILTKTPQNQQNKV